MGLVSACLVVLATLKSIVQGAVAFIHTHANFVESGPRKNLDEVSINPNANFGGSQGSPAIVHICAQQHESIQG